MVLFMNMKHGAMKETQSFGSKSLDSSAVNSSFIVNGMNIRSDTMKPAKLRQPTGQRLSKVRK